MTSVRGALSRLRIETAIRLLRFSRLFHALCTSFPVRLCGTGSRRGGNWACCSFYLAHCGVTHSGGSSYTATDVTGAAVQRRSLAEPTAVNDTQRLPTHDCRTRARQRLTNTRVHRR